MMNKLLLAIAVPMFLFSCDSPETLLDGDWDPIELSISKVSFGPNGGTSVVECKNYDSWWINGIRVNDAKIYYNPDHGSDLRSVSGDGIHAEIGTKKNTVVITVEPSQEKRRWTIEMEAWDAFTTISVEQNVE